MHGRFLSLVLVVSSAAFAAACNGSSTDTDAGHDAAPSDAADVTHPSDASDANTPVDAAPDGEPLDVATPDSSTPDSSTPDASPADASAPDAADGATSGSCHTNADCADTFYCAKAAGACDSVGMCTERPGVCGDFGMVCGCDGMGYFSACEAATHGVNVASSGDCP